MWPWSPNGTGYSLQSRSSSFLRRGCGCPLFTTQLHRIQSFLSAHSRRVCTLWLGRAAGQRATRSTRAHAAPLAEALRAGPQGAGRHAALAVLSLGPLWHFPRLAGPELTPGQNPTSTSSLGTLLSSAGRARAAASRLLSGPQGRRALLTDCRLPPWKRRGSRGAADSGQAGTRPPRAAADFWPSASR